MTSATPLQEVGGRSLLIFGLIGAALLYGDGVITPAISVLSAVEGVKLDAPQLAPAVLPLSIAILFVLFMVQRKGTQYIGDVFGPVMLLWFGVIGLLGLRGIIAAPPILTAVNPLHAVAYLVNAGPGIGFAVLEPRSWLSPAQKQCMPIWVTSAACPYGAAGLPSCYPLSC